jgi:5-methylcytosine-specific restriction endonuclease McrA
MDGPRKRTRQCVSCLKSFSYEVSRGKDRKYCTTGCIPKSPKPSIVCSVADCVRLIRSGNSPYCETHYYRVRRTGSIDVKPRAVKEASCSYCGAITNGAKHCGAKCSARELRSVPRYRTCLVCEGTYDSLTVSRRSVTCSGACRKQRTKVLAVEHYRREMQTEVGRDRHRRAEYKRKAAKVTAYVQDVDRGVVMDAGEWLCHLCGDSIPKQAEWPDPLFGTVDHVVPLSKGGEHSYANCKPAHLSCNCKKGNRMYVVERPMERVF